MKDLERLHHRCFPRKPSKLPADMTVYVDGETVFDKGSTIVENLSLSGALLTRIQTKKASFPLRPFLIHLRFKNKNYRGIRAVCRAVRLSVVDGELKVGVSFVEFSVSVE